MATATKTKVETRSFLSWVTEGLAAITADDMNKTAPAGPVKPGETQLGEASETTKRLWTLYEKARAAFEAHIHGISVQEIIFARERPAILDELMKERASLDVLREVLWAEVRSDCSAFPSDVGLREGWVIVKLVDEARLGISGAIFEIMSSFDCGDPTCPIHGTKN